MKTFQQFYEELEQARAQSSNRTAELLAQQKQAALEREDLRKKQMQQRAREIEDRQKEATEKQRDRQIANLQQQIETLRNK